MSADPTRASLEERYSRALDSSHMEVDPNHAGDVDYIMAAGMARETLGTTLLRLRAEWDAARGSQRHDAGIIRDLRDQCRAAERRLREIEQADYDSADSERSEVRGRIFDLRQRIDAESRMAKVQMFSAMSTLRDARDALGSFAFRQATIRRFMRPDTVVAAIAGRALDVWLDYTCEHCAGRGFNGLAPRILCVVCDGTGRRSVDFGKSYQERQFGSWLLTAMDSKADRAEKRMRRLLRSYAVKKDG